MPELCPFDYAVIRVVPRVEREEFINAGVILSCPSQNFLKAGIELDEQRLAALDSALDPAIVRQHLAAISLICEGGASAGPIGLLPPRSRFHWLVALTGPHGLLRRWRRNACSSAQDDGSLTRIRTRQFALYPTARIRNGK